MATQAIDQKRHIEFKSGAWIEINYKDGLPHTYDVSRSHGVGAKLEELAISIFNGFENCNKAQKLFSELAV